MRIVPVEISATLVWKGFRTPETGDWIGVCDSMGICLHAGSFAELQEIIAEALGALFRDLLKTGDIDQFMKERGWSLKTPIDPSIADATDVRLDVPWSVIPQANNDFQTIPLC